MKVYMKQLLILGLVFTSVLSVFGSGGSDAKQLSFGVVLETLDDEFTSTVKAELEKTAVAMGIAVRILGARGDSSVQLGLIDDFISAKVDAIIVQLINNVTAPHITQKLLNAKIPLVYVSRSPDDAAVPAGKKVAVVSSPEIEAGRGQSEYVISKLGNTGNVVILLGNLGSSRQVERTKGVEDYLEEYAPGINVLRKQTANWRRDNAQQILETWLESEENINAVFANNDEMAIGAAQALLKKELKDSVLVVGVNASSEGIEAVEAGYIDMTMFQNGRKQGKLAVETAFEMTMGNSFEQHIEIPFEPVTGENVLQYK